MYKNLVAVVLGINSETAPQSRTKAARQSGGGRALPVAGVMRRHRVVLIALIGIASSSAAWAQELPRAAPEEVGLAAARLDRIRRVVAQNVDEGKVAGAVLLVARHGKVAWFEAVGMRDREAGNGLNPDFADGAARTYRTLRR